MGRNHYFLKAFNMSNAAGLGSTHLVFKCISRQAVIVFSSDFLHLCSLYCFFIHGILYVCLLFLILFHCLKFSVS